MNAKQIETLRQQLSQAAHDELLSRFERVDAEIKADGSIVTEADRAMQQRVQAKLAELFPQYGFLGEEMSKSEKTAQIEQTGEQ